MSDFTRVQANVPGHRTKYEPVAGSMVIDWNPYADGSLDIYIPTGLVGDITITVNIVSGLPSIAKGDELYIHVRHEASTAAFKLNLPAVIEQSYQALAQNELAIIPSLTEGDFIICCTCIKDGSMNEVGYTAAFASRRISRDMFDENVGIRAMNKLLDFTPVAPNTGAGWSGSERYAEHYNVETLYLNPYNDKYYLGTMVYDGNIAGDTDARIMRSGTGHDWYTEHDFGNTYFVRDIAGDSNGIMCACLGHKTASSDQLIARSTDWGISWSHVTLPTAYSNLRGICVSGSNLWCCYEAGSNKVLMATNGAAWSEESVGSGPAVTCVASGAATGRRMWAGCTDGKVYWRNANAAGSGVWTEAHDLGSSTVSGIVMLGYYGMVVGRSSGIIRSTTDQGDTWTTRSSWAVGEWNFWDVARLTGGLYVVSATHGTGVDEPYGQLIFSWNNGRNWYTQASVGSSWRVSSSSAPGPRLYGMGSYQIAVKASQGTPIIQAVLSRKLNPSISQLA
jgi:hypothetical protein